MSRSMMQTVKARQDEDFRKGMIKIIVEDLYKKALNSARSGANTYNHAIPIVSQPSTNVAMKLTNTSIKYPAPYKKSSDPFYLENMPDILHNLQDLFPDCSISHSIMTKGTDGKLYDVAKLDDTVLPFVDRALDQSYIVIDWS